MNTFSQITGNFKEAYSSLLSDQSSRKVSNDNQESIRSMVSDTVNEPHSDIAEITEIPKDTEITGSMSSQANMKIAGCVKGNITSNANIMISGTVEGDISGEYISIHNGSIAGNIISKTCVIVSEKSVIKGDIICEKLTLNGDLSGNVQAQSSVTLGSFAVIHGNLTARYLSIQEGAVIDGSIKVDKDKEVSSESIYQIGFKIQTVAG